MSSTIEVDSNLVVKRKAERVVSVAIISCLTLGNCCLGQCPTARMEAVSGSGSNYKVGVTYCQEGCSTRYFLISGLDYFSEKTEEDETYWPCSASGRKYSLLAYGTEVNQMTVYFNPTTCEMTTTSSGSFGQTIERYSQSGSGEAEVDPCDVPPCCNSVPSYAYSSEYLNYVQISGDEGFRCTIDEPSAQYLVSQTTNQTCCSITITKVYYYANVYGSQKITIRSGQDTGCQDEYKTSLVIDRANQCAQHGLESQQSELEAGRGSPSANCAFSLADNTMSAGVTKAKWRLAIRGHVAKKNYFITLIWNVVENGKLTRVREVRSGAAPDDLVWYYPSASGELLEPLQKEECGYSYSKTFVEARVRQFGL